MKIIVCIKQVPDTTEIKIDPVRDTLIRTGVPSIMNPFDKNALEMALGLKDRYGAEVIALSMGPAQAKAVLKEALAMGADEAYLITDKAFGGSDTYATSYILSEVIRKLGNVDLVIGGKQAIDGDTGQTALSIAEHLGLPSISHVLDLEMDGERLLARRQIEEGVESIQTRLPALCTATKESNKPRYPHIKRKLMSMRAEIPEISFSDLPEIDHTKIGLKGSPTKVKKTFTPKREANGVFIEGETAEQAAENLVQKLLDAKIL